MVRKSFDKIVKIVRFEGDYSGQELFVFVGILMVAGTLLKLLGVFELDSDWFWFVAGLGLTVEGIISMTKQKRFNKKFKVLSREEFEKLINNQK